MDNYYDSPIGRAHRLRQLFCNANSLCLCITEVMDYLTEVYGVQFSTYEQIASDLNISVFRVENNIAHSSDAASQYLIDDGILSIIYKDNTLPERKVWSLAHEIGHIMCGHFGKHNLLSYGQMEIEANIFARELIAPSPLVMHYVVSNRGDNRIPITDCYFAYRNIFGMSKQAAFNSSQYLSKNFKDIPINPNLITDYTSAFNNTLKFVKSFSDYDYLVKSTIPEFRSQERYYAI